MPTVQSPLPTGAEDARVEELPEKGRLQSLERANGKYSLPVYTESEVTVNQYFSYKLRLRSELDATLPASPILPK